MLSVTPASAARFAELVKKIETSPAIYKKRRCSAKKKLRKVIKEQQRYAKTKGYRAVALTITYSKDSDFSRKHISAFIDSLRRTLKRLGHTLPYLWVLERASQLHYHLILWLPRDFKLEPAKLSKMWAFGSTWVQNCRSVSAWSRYISKFDSISRLPKGARIYGYGGLDEAGKLASARANMPMWLLSLLPAGHHARRFRGGGWIDTVTGEIYCSPYIWTPWGPKLRSAMLHH